MISHIEAQALVSARLDGPLDPIAERELTAHLATCAQCRAFAQASETLAQGLRELPYLPASPTVTRTVLERVDAGRSPWTRFSGLANANPGPALSTIAALVVLAVLGIFVFNRFLLDDRQQPEPGNQLLSATTQEATETVQPTNATFQIAAEGTETPAPTENIPPTTAPTEAAAAADTQAPTTAPTEAPTQAPTTAPTETLPPTTAPTATTAPTPEPTSTEEIVDLTTTQTAARAAGAAESTAIPEPTETTAPTATREPTVAPTNTPEPTATEEPTVAPTDTPEPTATEEPTPDPTNTPEPTATLEPTPEPTLEPTPAPTATPTEEVPPPIEPLNGTYAADETGPAAEPPTEAPTPEPTLAPTPEPTAEPTGAPAVISPAESTTQPTAEATEEPTPEENVIQPIDGTETTPAQEPTPEASRTAPPEQTGGQAGDLESSSIDAGNIPGQGRLMLTSDGSVIRRETPNQAPISSNGLRADTIDGDYGQAVAVCTENDECTDVTTASKDGEASTDTPLGWLGDGIVYERMAGGAFEYRRVTVATDAGEATGDDVLLTGDATIESNPPAYSDGETMLVPTTSGGWVVLTPGGGHEAPNQYGKPQLLRMSNANFDSSYVSYVAGDQLVIAPIDDPGSAITVLPFNGVDYDISPDATQVVISTGSAVEIYSVEGELVASWDAGSMQTGSVLWLRQGIYVVDESTGTVRIIEGAGQ